MTVPPRLVLGKQCDHWPGHCTPSKHRTVSFGLNCNCSRRHSPTLFFEGGKQPLLQLQLPGPASWLPQPEPRSARCLPRYACDLLRSSTVDPHHVAQVEPPLELVDLGRQGGIICRSGPSPGWRDRPARTLYSLKHHTSGLATDVSEAERQPQLQQAPLTDVIF